jgi:hypothetical protein
VKKLSPDCALFDHFAVMVAPHLSGLFAMQSDFGHPAGAVVGVVGDLSFRTFSRIWLVARGLTICMRGAG